MEMKWLVIPLFLITTGCAQQAVKLRTETVEVIKPVLFCPAPNREELNRPESLPLEQIKSTSSDGEIAVLYKASVKQLLDYITRLELVLDQYDNVNTTYEDLIKELGLENIQ